MKTLLRSLLDWPACCDICARWPARPVCDACSADLGRVQPRCPRCALPLAPGLALCARCVEGSAGPLQRCSARVDYAWPWSALVARLKTDPAWAGELARLTLQQPEARELLQRAELIAPIPLSARRLRERGFNQAWEFARALRRQMPTSADAIPALLQRRQDAQQQHLLQREQRFENMQRAYSVAIDSRARLQRRRVLLVDDVMTTGATLQAAAAALLAAGAAEVGAIVFARTPAPTPED